MSRIGRMLDCNRSVLSLGLFFCLSLWAQQPADPGSAASSNSIPKSLSPLRSVLAKPPVDLFRDLLGMSQPERLKFLETRSAEAQKLILAKLQEYEALKPDQRELRLRVTELRWYLKLVLSTPASARAELLDAIPPDLRMMIEDRLQQWDKLSAEAQKQLLENQSTVQFYSDLAATAPEQRAAKVQNLPEADREKLEAGIRRWRALTEEQRQSVLVHFYQFLNLTPGEQENLLQTLSEPERLQIEKTLQTFEVLTPVQRAQCLRSFQKFASLSPDERRQFLKNAERWKLMTPAERQSWRNLVSNLSRQPPPPPGFSSPPLPSAPGQHISAPSGSANSVVTNSN